MSRELRNALQLSDQLLPGVSRTFALTIPQLPDGLREPITNAYLLCRIADTIEDDLSLSRQQKAGFHQRFIEVVSGTMPVANFGAELAPLLSKKTPADEIELIKQTAGVIEVTHSFNERQRAALQRCITIMCHGMPQYQEDKSIAGLPTVADMDQYCYYVAGVVGEMLTELFCDYSTTIATHRSSMMPLAVAFGQGLQMTNILKDFWEDRAAAACWLPQELFHSHGLNLADADSPAFQNRFEKGIEELLGMAHAYLRDALGYVHLIPSNEIGIRRFCLWAIGLAVHTLQSIRRHPEYRTGAAVKISRASVRRIMLISNLCSRSNRLLRFGFKMLARGLPLKSELMQSNQAWASSR
ncbi:MAG: phytoene/squalene synthase family protein [Lysobacterales bacterium]